MYVDFIRDGHKGDGLARMGNSRWRRITEQRCRAKSVFHFDVPGSVAKSTFAGIPWLRFLRRELRARIHFWPFDGFDVPDDRSVIAEAYPALWNADIPLDEWSGDQRDAYAIALALRDADASGRLANWFDPPMSDGERAVARFEGWILGLMEPGTRPKLTVNEDASWRRKHPNQLIIDAVTETKGAQWNAETRKVARTDSMRVLEAMVAEFGVNGAIQALDNQGFAGEAYRYLLDQLHDEAMRRRAASKDND